MEIYRIQKDTDEWLYKAYDYVRTDAFCFGQNIPVELEFSGDGDKDELEGVIIIEDHKPVAGCRITYPEDGVGKIERVCVIREKQKAGYGRVLIHEAEKWIAEKGVKHIVINSQDRAAGFYNKLGYVTNHDIDPHIYEKKHERKKPVVEVNIPKLDLGFTTVLVEKYID
ncbi:MAG: GNAT family N-acetyltransferase [Lachnospira sp.]